MFAKIAWFVLAATHALPALAAIRPALLTALYGIEQGSTAFLLIHHRAMLFIAILFACLWAAFAAEVRRLALVVTAISMLGFLLLYWLGGAQQALRTIAVADLIALPALAYAAWDAFGPARRSQAQSNSGGLPARPMLRLMGRSRSATARAILRRAGRSSISLPNRVSQCW